MPHPSTPSAQPQQSQDISHIPGYARPSRKSHKVKAPIPGHLERALRGDDKDLSKVAILSDN